MSNSFQIRPTHFSCGGKIFSRGGSAPSGYGPVGFYASQKKISCVLCPHSQFLCNLAKFYLANQGVRQPVQPHTFNAQLLVFDETLPQPDFAAVNCSDAVMSVFHSPVLTRSLIFALMNCCVVALNLFFSGSLTWSADSLYSVQ